ncbi:DUF5776 domain-containing protein [Levilactobacillus tongjiangensis]|uniref:DUF5776 domain-containing protein n=1 Tax=Levilactobacillus tongjiangensis TaxID=2486023 RepID=A0ABW1STT4_9LACO|nr:DUF5776 domain-containing protein [Levilactobacillus tongjiangensis]
MKHYWGRILLVMVVFFGVLWGVPQLLTTQTVSQADTVTPTNTGTVTVQYRYANIQDRKLAPDDVLTGTVGASYQTQPKSIPNYTLKTTSVDGETGTFLDKPQTVTYLYVKNVDLAPAGPNMAASIKGGGAGVVVTGTTPTGDMVTKLYNNNGGIVEGRGLSENFDIFTDQAMVNLQDGTLYYHVSTNEWVKASDMTVTSKDDPVRSYTTKINFVTTAGKVIKAPETVTAIFDICPGLKTANLTIPGYQLTGTKSSTAGEFTYIYRATTGGGTTTPTAPTKPLVPGTPSPSDPVVVAQKGAAVSAVKKVGLYRTVDFKRSTRIHWYRQQVRSQRPQFVVIGYKRTAAGTLRYRVRDVNHRAKTAGQVGYITANDSLVVPTYFSRNPRRIKVINPRGINAYRNRDLSGTATRHFKRGTTVKIRGIQSYHLTTRLVLANGRYVTANKTLVMKK